jgi:hypothetical protein
MLLGVARLKRAVSVLPVVVLASLALLSCSSSSNNQGATTSGLKFRAFVSQDVSTNTATPAVIIIDAKKDLQAARVSSGGTGGLLGGSFLPAMLIESNNRQTTLAVSSSGTQVQVISNSSEAATGTVTLPGITESVVISVDGTTAYAAVPTAQIPQGTPGALVAISLTTGQVSATVPIPGAHYVVQSGDGSRLLVFSNNKDLLNTITIVAPFNIVQGQQNSVCLPNVCTTTSGFDRPVYGFFSSDNSQAWILNCGPQCGGQQPSVQVLDLVNGHAGALVPVDAATVGFVNNQTLYVAGTPTAPAGSTTPPNNTCAGITTAAPTCGRLDIVDLPSLTVTNSLVITDGYHTQINIQDGQLFVGSKLCSNVIPPPAPATGEQRGCLTIVNTVPSTLTQANVVFPPDNFDVTGLQPITNRTIMYVVEGGQLRIYDTTTDKIYLLTSITVIGNAVDVKLVDF